MTRLAAVALPLPVADPYTYAIPDTLAARVQPGARVEVPVRGRTALGIVVAVDVPPPGVPPRALLAAPDEEPALAPDLLATGDWMARYYGAPIGLALRAMLPGPLWGVTGGREARERWLVLAAEPLPLLERERLFARARRQRELYEAVEALGGSASLQHLEATLGFRRDLARALVERGLAAIADTPRTRDPFSGAAAPLAPPAPAPDQRAAIARLAALGAGEVALLQGVTGSGKTLVYLELIRAVLARGQGAILLVPEIGLTPQTVARVRGAFGEEVAVLHSGLSDGERADQWRALRRGERRVVVGARSALFAPIAPLGLIVIDEEHDGSYKHGEAPRYHARDVAAVRARLAGASVVLGSATPAIETAARRALVHVRLDARIGGRPLPPVEVIDLRTAPQVAEARPVPWSEALDVAVGAALGRGEQVLLLLNRRGIAAFVQCPACGHVPTCPDCSISLTPHRDPPGLRCHYCAHAAPPALACSACGHAVQVMRGVGTQQLERVVGERFPAARVARADVDTMSTRSAHDRLYAAMHRREVDLLIGTQMVAKGLDFPEVTLVGVVDADVGMHLPDFRAAERTFQLLAQVAGRAGRGPRGGRVLVQTRDPGHHALACAAAHDPDRFLAEELRLRASPAYPPHTHLVNLLLTSEDEGEVAAAAVRLAEWCRRVAGPAGCLVLGPAPAPIQRLHGRYRWHVLLKGDPPPLGKVVRALARWRGRVRLAIDRDPLSLL